MKRAFLIIISIVLITSGCTKLPGGDTGRIIVKVTDDPFNINLVESATVTVDKIELRRAAADTTGKDPFITLSVEPVTFDLLKLRNGITARLLDLEIPSGKYDLVRLYVTQAGMKITDQAKDFSLKIPGGAQTGIKIFLKPALEVGGGLTSELLLDFDLSRSFVMQGNLNHGSGVKGFIFKPVIRAVNNSVAGRIEGSVSDESETFLENAKVWIIKDTTTFAASFSDASGKYAMIGIPEGSYDLFAWKQDFDTLKIEAIRVTGGNKTLQDITLHK